MSDEEQFIFTNAFVIVGREGRAFIMRPTPDGRIVLRIELEGGGVVNNFLNEEAVTAMAIWLNKWLGEKA